ncbi:MAG: hypothetical protein GXP16_15900 [Gammaproteobacteria bacterium]|nr:hypothetical protein [Gammaproteobacteria bacterium]
MGQVLRDEEFACASHARRLLATAEAKDSLHRMERNSGVRLGAFLVGC